MGVLEQQHRVPNSTALVLVVFDILVELQLGLVGERGQNREFPTSREGEKHAHVSVRVALNPGLE